MTAPKNVAFIGLQLENCYLVGEIDFWWAGGGVYWEGGILLGWEGNEQMFRWKEGTSLIHLVGKTLSAVTKYRKSHSLLRETTVTTYRNPSTAY